MNPAFGARVGCCQPQLSGNLIGGRLCSIERQAPLQRRDVEKARLLHQYAFQGNEQTGPFGHGNSPTEAINKLVDIAELRLRAASDSPVLTELQEVPQ